MRTLVIDAATPTLYLGVIIDSHLAHLSSIEVPTGTLETFFTHAQSLFAAHPLSGFDRIALCLGPGRLMSLRIAAMAATIWGSPAQRYSYSSLALASLHSGGPTAYQLRAGGPYATYTGTAIHITPTITPDTLLIGSAAATPSSPGFSYTQAITHTLPAHLPTLLSPTPTFCPPVYAPLSYALAAPTAISAPRSS